MKKILTFLLSIVAIDGEAARRRAIENYLAKSTDLVDLERRQRQLTHSNNNLHLY